jgi:hypothetical protein
VNKQIEEIVEKLKKAEEDLPKELRDIYPKGYVYKIMVEAAEKKKREQEE